MDSGDDSSFSDNSGSDSGHVASSATTLTCANSPGVSSPNEGKIKYTVLGGEDGGGPVAAALNLQEHQDSSWPDIDQIFDSGLVFEDHAAEDRCQKMGDIEDKLGSDGTKDDGETEDGSQEMDHNVNGAGDEPGDEDGVEYGGEAPIVDPGMDGIEVDGGGPHSKGDHRAKVGGDAEGWCYPYVSFVSELTLQFQESRTRSIPKSFKR